MIGTAAAASLLAIALALPAEPSHAQAVSSPFQLEVGNEFGPLSDVGRTSIALYVRPAAGDAPVHFRCGSLLVQRSPGGFQLVVTIDPGPPASYDPSCFAEALVGPLAPGPYRIDARMVSGDGATIADQTLPVTIPARGQQCNVDPFVNQLLATPAIANVEAFGNAFTNDAAFRARFEPVVYLRVATQDYVILAFPPLDDPVRVMERLWNTGEFKRLGLNGNICFSGGPPPVYATAVEYHNRLLDHYFFTADDGEQRSIDAGLVGPGWVRTGKMFQVLTVPSCPSATEGGSHPIYRFAGIPGIGPNSHFFTASPRECAVVRDRTDWGWQFEGAPFWASEPVNGSCPAQTRLLFRAYNNGKGGTPNHRYTTERAVIDAMGNEGWTDEGPVMCVAAD